MMAKIDMKRIFCLMAVVLLAVSCNRKLEEMELDAGTFVKFSDYGLVKGHKYLFKYDEQVCQMVNNEARGLLRMQSDTQSSFVNAVFSDSAHGVGVELAYKQETGDEIITLSMEMVLLKREDKKVWLWSRDMNMGLIVSPIIKKTD